MLGGLRPRGVPVDDNGLVVDIISWVLLAVMVVILFIRSVMKLALSKKARKFGWDDVAILFAALFSIGQTIASCSVAVEVLGHHVADLTPRQVEHFQTTQYASLILYVANLGCARVSLSFFIRDIIAGTTQKKIALGMVILNLLWTFSAVLAAAFPCAAPHVWKFLTDDGKYLDNNCYDCPTFTNYVAASNIFLDCLIILFPLVFWNVRVSSVRMVAIFFAFASRLAVIGSIVPAVVFFNRYRTYLDFSFNWWRVVLCFELAQNFSVITACIPCLSPFLLSLQCGKRRPDDLRIYHLGEKCEEKQFDSMQSSSSTSPLRTSHYVAPLATYGLTDRDSHASGDYFNRSIDYPRPFTASSSQSTPQEPPKALTQVGILPTIDWETDSEKQSTGGRSTPSARNPDSEYVFNREKVISVPEAGKLYEGKAEDLFQHNSWS